MGGLINFTWSGFPNGYCYPGDPNDFASDLLAATSITFNTSTGNFYYNYGANVPSVDNRVYPWYRCETNDGFEGWHFWDTSPDGNTGWLRPHSVPASSDYRVLWIGTTAALTTFDGGQNVAVDDCHGPFWEVDTNFAARIPMGPGTTSGGTVITVATNAGADEQNITLAADQLPEHYHKVNVEGDGLGPPETETDGYLRVGAGLEVDWITTSAGPKNQYGKTYSEIDDGTATQDTVDVGLIPPVYGAYVIKRTDRVYYFIT